MSAARMTSLGSSPSHTRLQGGGRGAGAPGRAWRRWAQAERACALARLRACACMDASAQHARPERLVPGRLAHRWTLRASPHPQGARAARRRRAHAPLPDWPAPAPPRRPRRGPRPRRGGRARRGLRRVWRRAWGRGRRATTRTCPLQTNGTPARWADHITSDRRASRIRSQVRSQRCGAYRAAEHSTRQRPRSRGRRSRRAARATAGPPPPGAAGRRRPRGGCSRAGTRVSQAGAAQPLPPHTHTHALAQTQALMQLARVHNLLPSFLLVMVGAWVRTLRHLGIL